MKGKEVSVASENLPAENLIQIAIEKGVPVETMEKLLAMRRELKAEAAKEAFGLAMANFQKECPVITKTKIVYEKGSDTKVRYKFAPLDSIVEQVKAYIANNGFSYSIKTLSDEKGMTVVCKVTHTLGHSEDSPFFVPIGTEDYMSAVQKYGARSTFAKRYAFCNAFGIMTGDEDNDASEAGKTPQKGKFTKDDTKEKELAVKTIIALRDKMEKPLSEAKMKSLLSYPLEQLKQTQKALEKEMTEFMSDKNKNIKDDEIPTVKPEPTRMPVNGVEQAEALGQAVMPEAPKKGRSKKSV